MIWAYRCVSCINCGLSSFDLFNNYSISLQNMHANFQPFTRSFAMAIQHPSLVDLWDWFPDPRANLVSGACLSSTSSVFPELGGPYEPYQVHVSGRNQKRLGPRSEDVLTILRGKMSISNIESDVIAWGDNLPSIFVQVYFPYCARPTERRVLPVN